MYDDADMNIFKRGNTDIRILWIKIPYKRYFPESYHAINLCDTRTDSFNTWEGLVD
jgi:hypothetical protein